MKMPIFTKLDVIVAVVGVCAIALVVYLYRMQGRLYLTELLMMGLYIVGYWTYRQKPTQKKPEHDATAKAATNEERA